MLEIALFRSLYSLPLSVQTIPTLPTDEVILLRIQLYRYVQDHVKYLCIVFARASLQRARVLTTTTTTAAAAIITIMIQQLSAWLSHVVIVIIISLHVNKPILFDQIKDRKYVS